MRARSGLRQRKGWGRGGACERGRGLLAGAGLREAGPGAAQDRPGKGPGRAARGGAGGPGVGEGVAGAYSLQSARWSHMG